MHQHAPSPAVDGAVKPMKPGGYRDSSADIAFALRRRFPVVTPVDDPHPERDDDWSFPDDAAGIAAAHRAGAKVLWANTVLYAGHPLESAGVPIVGNRPAVVGRFDDKPACNEFLASHGLPIAAHGDAALGRFPVVVKPIRGRGSQGVRVVHDEETLRAALASPGMYVEEWLPGDEVTVAVIPGFGALPVVERTRHVDGVMPYNGVEPVVRNSRLAKGDWTGLQRQCERAAELIGATGVVRIDCRQDRAGQWRLFDVNLKPNLTGPGRPGRDEQTSLVGIAAAGIGWDYVELIARLAARSILAR